MSQPTQNSDVDSPRRGVRTRKESCPSPSLPSSFPATSLYANPPSSAAATPPRVRPEPKDTHAQGSPPAVLSRPVSYRVCVVRRASCVIRRVCGGHGTAGKRSNAMPTRRRRKIKEIKTHLSFRRAFTTLATAERTHVRCFLV